MENAIYVRPVIAVNKLAFRFNIDILVLLKIVFKFKSIHYYIRYILFNFYIEGEIYVVSRRCMYM